MYFTSEYDDMNSELYGKMYQGLFITFIAIPLVIPTTVCIICAVIQIYSILKPSTISPPSIRERRMTVTIIMLTLVCLVCNVPYTGSYIYILLNTNMGEGLSIQIIGFSYIFNTLLPFIQAILNPTILLMRGAALRSFVVTNFRRLFNRRLSENSNETEMVVITNGANIGADRT